ncbi:MAG: hypothetical protein AAGE86_04830 [Pseudomonadota bacterium]
MLLSGALACSGSVLLAQDSSESASQITQVGEAETRQASNTEAAQIGTGAAAKAYWSQDVQVSSADSTAPVVDARQDQASMPDGSKAAPQISSSNDSERAIAQLNLGDLEGTLAQLSDAERQVLLDAIQGTDVCDNPPDIPAIRELCETRIETRSTEFAARDVNTLSAEERLLGESLDRTRTATTLDRDVERLARNAGRGDANSLDTQAIASVALGTPQPAQPDQPVGTQLSDLPSDTQALINALVQQLGGATGAPPQ